MSYLSNKEAFDPNKLLDTVIEKLNLKNDAALSRKLEVRPPVISKIRHRRLPVGASLLIRMHEVTGLNIKELRLLMSTSGDQNKDGESARPISTGRTTRSLGQQRDGKLNVPNRSLPAWTEGLDIQIAKILVWKGFKDKVEVQAVLERGERIDRIGPARLAMLRNWLEPSPYCANPTNSTT